MKNSIFKRKLNRPPAPKASGDDDDNDSFFSRGDDVFKKRAAEAAVRKREAEEAQRLEKQAEPNVSDEITTIEDDPLKGRRPKRARLSHDNEEDIEDGAGPDKSPLSPTAPNEPSSSTKHKSPDAASPTKSGRSPKSLTGRFERATATRASQRKQEPVMVVDLEDSDEEDAPLQQEEDVDVTEVKPIDHEEEEVDSDPELASIARRARETARRRRLQEDAPTTSTEPSTSLASHTILSPSRDEAPLASPERAQDDPIVQILITSERANMKPLIVERRFSQRLKEVRWQWCHQQGYTQDPANREAYVNGLKKDIILMDKGKRVYDTTSCRGLGLMVVDGQVVLQSDQHREKEKIHLVAITIDDYENAEKEKYRRAQAEETDDYEPPPVVEEPKDDGIKLVLRARGLEDFKVKARMHNPISKLLNAFKKVRGLGPEQEVFAVFDGERLDSDTLVEDCDFEDMDCLDLTIT